MREKAQEIWRRIRLEFVVELPLLKERWKTILFGAAFQYVHAMSAQLAHRMHQPLPQPLHDVGFALLPELGKRNEWVSETIFTVLFVSFLLWSFSPFVMARKRFYTVVLYARLLMVLVCCQTLRIISFTATQLPSPNYHCRTPATTSVLPWPERWWGHVSVDLQQQTTHGCGDLIFSSHTTFALVGVLTYTEYGSTLLTKVLCWLAVATLSVLIVASRKHYTVDVVIAWYAVPLVFWTLHRRWTTKRVATDWPHRAAEPALELAQIVVAEGGSPSGPRLNGSGPTNGQVKGWRTEPLEGRSPGRPPLANGYMHGHNSLHQQQQQHERDKSHGREYEQPSAPSYESSFSSGSGGEGGSSNRQNSVSVARARTVQLAGIAEADKSDDERGPAQQSRRQLNGTYGRSPPPGRGGGGGDAGAPRSGGNAPVVLSPADPSIGCSLS